MRRETIKRLFDQLVIGDGGWAGRQAVEPGRTLAIIGKQGMNIGAEHAAVGRNRALLRLIVQPREWPRTIGASRDPHMHFISGKRNPASRLAADRLQPLVIR